MLSETMMYQVLILTVLLLWTVYLLFSLFYPRLAPYRLILFIVLVVLAVLFRIFMINPVYIIHDDNSIEEKKLLIPTTLLLQNGQKVILSTVVSPSYRWLVNDSARAVQFEKVVYGGNAGSTELITYPPYSIGSISHIHYFFEVPPNELKTIMYPVSKGWLHR